MNTDEIINEILYREGGFIDHPADRGGPTNHGITQATLADWRGRPATKDDVRSLNKSEAREIYRERYMIAPGLHKILDARVRAHAVDCSVNHGPRQAVQLLQYAARTFPDGILGPKTESAANRMEPRALYARMCAARVRLYGRIIRRDGSQHVFAEGWCNRVAEFIEEIES